MGKIIKLTEGDLIHLIKRVLAEETEMTEACWKGYTKKGMKTMFGKKYPNCVKNESEDEETNEASSPAQQAAIAINMKKKGIKPKNETLYEDEYGSVESIDYEEEFINEAEYQGRKVQLGKIMQGDVRSPRYMLKTIRVRLLRLTLGLVVNLLKVKEWLLKRITQKDVSHLEQDIIVKIQDHVGNQDIGLVVLGN